MDRGAVARKTLPVSGWAMIVPSSVAVAILVVALSLAGVFFRHWEALENRLVNLAIDDIGRHRMLSMAVRALASEFLLPETTVSPGQLREVTVGLMEANERAIRYVRAAHSLGGTGVLSQLEDLGRQISDLRALIAALLRSEEGAATRLPLLMDRVHLARIAQATDAISLVASSINSAIATEHRPAAETADHARQNVIALVIVGLASLYTALVTVPIWRRMRDEAVRLQRMSEGLWKLAAVAHRTTNVVVVTDVEGRIEWVNGAFERVTGYTGSEVIGHSYSGLLRPSGSDGGLVNTVLAAIHACEDLQIEMQNCAKDGRIYWVSIDIQPIKSTTGDMVGFIAIESDISELKIANAEITSRNSDLEIMSALANIGEWAVDAGTGEVFWSEGVRRIHEVDDHFVPNLEAVLQFYSNDAQTKLIQAMEECLNTGRSWQGELHMRTAKRNDRWVRINVTAVREDRRIAKLVGAIQDVTEMVEARDVIALSSRRLELALEGASIGLWDWDVVADRIWIHPKWWAHLGYTAAPSPFPFSKVSLGIHPDDLAGFEATVQTFLEGGSAEVVAEFRHLDASGDWRWISTVGRATETLVGGRVLRASGVHVDIHDRKLAAERAMYAAAHDALTGLRNRAEFVRTIERELEQHYTPEREFAVISVDLDRFKHINDSYGHLAGDSLLIEIGQRLQAAVRDTDVVARLGGDEFAILLTGRNDRALQVEKVCRRIIDTIRRPVLHEGRSFDVGASLGIAIYPRHGTTVEDLLRAADSALYSVKAESKNNFRVFDLALAERDKQRRMLESELRVAIERNELELHFQAQYDLQSREPKSAEALLRWRNPIRGLVAPDQFIPIAEETDLIVPIGQWVIEEACRLASQWPYPFPVSVNLSAAQLGKTNLFDTVTTALIRANLDARRLEIEVTESVFMRDDDTLLNDLRRLNNVGVRLALDDFGTGYASLGYLNKLPFDRIKIDRSFVSGVPGNPKSESIVRAVVQLSQSLGMEATAEGVETETQLEFLRDVGCTMAQGYLFSRPVAVDELLASFAMARQEGPAQSVLALESHQ